jgi:uncharacterized membrane protein YkvA (DUF1232 family)
MSKFIPLRSARTLKAAHGVYQHRRTLFQMLREVFNGKYRMSLLTNMALLFGLLYIISPLDFDWIPILGWVDDGIIFYLLVQRLQKETQRFNRNKAMERRLS